MGTVEMDSGSGTVEMHVEVELWKCNLWKWSAHQDWETGQGPGPILPIL